jgi:tetratricopeptide (TPR) repeat protein
MRRIWILLLMALVAAPTPALAWSARKAAKPATHHEGKHAVHGHKPAGNAGHGAAITAIQNGKLTVKPAIALKLLKQDVAAREMADAVHIAEALLAARKVSRQILADAATALGSSNDYPVQLRIWQKLNDDAHGHGFSEGYIDALLAAGDVAKARDLLQAAIAKMSVGKRRAALERLVVVSRLDGSTRETMQQLQAMRDPDAAVLAAQLLEEQGDADLAADELGHAWQRFPGHRALQAAYQALLVRLGRREELAKVVAEVVKLAPADPMPWLGLLDAHIAARDLEAARNLIDELAHKHPKHDVLLEALIDREQRIGDAPARVEALYQQLLAAAPHEAQYVEAYAEWLLSRSDNQPGRSDEPVLALLARLQKPPADEWLGLTKSAAILMNHNRFVAARKLVQALNAKKPGDPRGTRLLAMLDEKEGRPLDAIVQWTALTALPDKPEAADRQRAMEARLALSALLRRTSRLGDVAAAMRAKIDAGQATRAEVLLWLDVQMQLDDGRDALGDNDWQKTAERGRQAFPDDEEIGQAVATGLLNRGKLAEALPAVEQLAKQDRDAATLLVSQAVEMALAHADPALVKRLEALLVSGDGMAQSSVLMRLGDLHLRLGDNAGATALFRQAAQQNTRDTRAVGRLATLFRLAGAVDEEDKALRDIVARAADSDEIDAAGQRLLAVALGAGRLGELVRWLDTILPQHARRDLLERLRMTGYDLWLRTLPLESALGHKGPEPMASGVGDALSSGDLALQVKALRQLAELHRSVPLAIAKQLLVAQNPALRRDVTLLLGASGSEEASKLLVAVIDGHDIRVDGGMDQDEEVRGAQLAALVQLPPAPGVERVLDDAIRRNEWLALLAMGKLAGPNPALARLSDVLVASRREATPYALVALGTLVGRSGEEPSARDATDKLLLFSPLRTGPGDFARQTAALWSMAASGQARTTLEMWQVALDAPERPLRHMAVRLLAAPQPPRMVVPELRPAEGDTGHDMKNRILRATLLPWLSEDEAALSQALQQLDGELTRAATTRQVEGDGSAWRQTWCASWLRADGTSLAGTQLRQFCALK